MSAWTIDGPSSRRGSPSQTSTARSSSTAVCSGWSCSGGGSTRSRRSRGSSACPRRPGSRSRCCACPGSEVDVELLQYHGCESPSGQLAALAPRHGPLLRLRHRDRRALRGAAARGVSFRSDGPVEMSAGAERGRQEPLLARPGRLHLRVPPAAAPMSVEAIDVERPADRPPLARAVPADGADPPLRGPRRRALPAGRHLRHGAQLRRAGGDRRRRRRRHARHRLPRRPPPLARPPDRGRRRPPPDDGRDVREADGLLQGARRLDAHRRPLARHPRLQRDRRRRDPARVRRGPDREAARDGAGGGRLLRRRRRRPGRGARGDEPRRDLDAAGRLRLREQPVRALGRLAGAARGRGSRRPRGRLRDAGRDRRRQRPARGRGRGRASARRGRAKAPARRSSR